jgi:peroxiredoxin
MCPMGGARLSAGPPKRGELMHDFVLTSARGERVQLSDYRGRQNLVLILAGHGELGLLKDLAQRQRALRSEQAQALAVVAGTKADAARIQQETQAPFAVLADPDGQVHASMGAIKNGEPAPALYTTDRFGEVFAAFRMAEGRSLPDAEDILDWLGFVNSQCEECNPPEWPAVG